MNNAPTQGFEADVGQRTDVRVAWQDGMRRSLSGYPPVMTAETLLVATPDSYGNRLWTSETMPCPMTSWS